MSIEKCIYELKKLFYSKKSDLRVGNYFFVAKIDTPNSTEEYLFCDHLLLFKRYFNDSWEDLYSESKLLVYLLEVIIPIVHNNNIQEIKLCSNLFCIFTGYEWLLVSNVTSEIIYDFRTKKGNQGYIYVRPRIR